VLKIEYILFDNVLYSEIVDILLCGFDFVDSSLTNNTLLKEIGFVLSGLVLIKSTAFIDILF
jgi:hypothetical protein